MTQRGESAGNESVDEQGRLRVVLRRLVQLENWVGVIQVAERMGAQQRLPEEFLLAEARAFRALCLMDRAWVRLREVTDQAPNREDALLETAEMFVARGWPARAAKLLQRLPRGVSDAERLKRLQCAAKEPAIAPPSNAKQLEKSGTLDEVLHLAEVYLSTGNLLRAKGLLERLHRLGFAEARVAALLWGINGDFSTSSMTLDEFLDKLRSWEPDAWDRLDLTETVAKGDLSPDPETAELRLDSVEQPVEKGGQSIGFPHLFRRDDPAAGQSMGETDSDITVASVMSASDEYGNESTSEVTDSVEDLAGGLGDTQIMQVIPRDGTPEIKAPEGPMHRKREGVADKLRDNLDLDAYLKSMGMTARLSIDKDDESDEWNSGDFLEDEDEDLVVMTRKEGGSIAHPASSHSGKVEVVERAVGEENSDPGPEQDGEGMAVQTGATPSLDDRSGATPPQNPWFSGVVGFGMALVVTIAVVAAALFVVQNVAQRRVQDDVHAAILEGDPWRMMELENGIAKQVQAQTMPVGGRAAELALLRAVLWVDHVGQAENLVQVKESIASAEAGHGPPEELALAKAVMALGLGNVEAAEKRLMTVPPGHPLYAGLAGRVALVAKDRDLALELIGQADQDQLTPMQWMVWPELAELAGQGVLAAGLKAEGWSRAPEHPGLFLKAHEGNWGGVTPKKQLADLNALLESADVRLSPRQRGAAFAVRAGIFEEMEELEQAEETWSRALAADPSHPAYLYWAGVSDFMANRTVDALDTFERCLRAAPYDLQCRLGWIHGSLELDRTEEVRALLQAQPFPDSLQHVVAAWTDLVAGEPSQAKQAATELLTTEKSGEPAGIAWYVVGLAMGQLGEDSLKVGRALGRASTMLGDTEDRLDNRMANRALAARVLFGSENLAVKRAAVLSVQDIQDPGIYVYLGQHEERLGNMGRAREYLDESVQMGPEYALAHFAKGHFYYQQVHDDAEALRSWAAYLDLNPSGKRAARMRERLGR